MISRSALCPTLLRRPLECYAGMIVDKVARLSSPARGFLRRSRTAPSSRRGCISSRRHFKTSPSTAPRSESTSAPVKPGEIWLVNEACRLYLASESARAFARAIRDPLPRRLGRLLGGTAKTVLDRQFSIRGHPCLPIGLEVRADFAPADHAFEDLVGIGACASLSQGAGIVQVQRYDHPLDR